MNKSLIIALLHFALLTGARVTFAQQCGSRKLDPRVVAFLERVGYQDMTIEELRNLPIGVIKYPIIPASAYPEQDVQRIKITADSIPVLVFNPSHSTNLPVLVNFHGGGFISPLIKGLEYSLWQEAKTYGAVVFAVDYRVAPEYAFPAAVNDSYNAFKWIAAHATGFGGDTSRIVLYGNSAGANLAAVVSQKAKKDGLQHKIRLQVLNGLPGDLSPENMEGAASYQENATGYWQTKAACYFSAELYAAGQYNNPEVSPLKATDFSGLPPAVIFNAEFDPLRDDGIRYAAELRKQGIKVWDKCFAGQIHLLLGLPPAAAEIKEMEEMVKAAMKECFR